MNIFDDRRVNLKYVYIELSLVMAGACFENLLSANMKTGSCDKI